MVLALTAWGWSGLVAAVAVIAFLWVRHAWRVAVRDEMLDYLERALPDVDVTHLRANLLQCRSRSHQEPAPPGSVDLCAFYRELKQHPGGSAEAEAARRQVFAALARAVRESAHGDAAGSDGRRAS